MCPFFSPRSQTAGVTAAGSALGRRWKGSSLKGRLWWATMAQLNVNLIAKSRNHFKKKQGLPEYLRTLTHLHFSSKNIEDIVSVHCWTVSVFDSCAFLTLMCLHIFKISFSGWYLHVQKPHSPLPVRQPDHRHLQPGLCLQPHPPVHAEQQHRSHRQPLQSADAFQTVSRQV